MSGKQVGRLWLQACPLWLQACRLWLQVCRLWSSATWIKQIVWAQTLAGLFCLLAFSAQADLQDVFTVRLPVAARVAEVDSAQVNEGLKQVVERLIRGDARITAQLAQGLFKQPMDYLRDYRYESVTELQQGAALLVLNFDGDAIQSYLQQRSDPNQRPNQSSTGLASGIEAAGDRPRLLHWWAVENTTQRQLVADPAAPWAAPTTLAFAEALAAASTAHALSMQLPLMDPRDARLVQPRDVFGFLLEPIQKASQRYPHTGLVIGTVKSTANAQWQGHWMLVIGEKSYWFEDQQATLEALLEKALTSINQQLNQAQAPIATTAKPQWLVLNLRQITRFEQQQAASAFLAALPWIKTVQLQQIQPTQVQYRLLTALSATQIAELWATEKRLTLDTAVNQTAAMAAKSVSKPAEPQIDLTYRWLE